MRVEIRKYKIPFIYKWVVKVKIVTDDQRQADHFYNRILNSFGVERKRDGV